MDDATRREGVRLVVACAAASGAPRAVTRRALHLFAELYARAAATQALAAPVPPHGQDDVGYVPAAVCPDSAPLESWHTFGTLRRSMRIKSRLASGAEGAAGRDRVASAVPGGDSGFGASTPLARPRAALAAAGACVQLASKMVFSDGERGQPGAFRALGCNDILRLMHTSTQGACTYPLCPSDARAAELATLVAVAGVGGEGGGTCGACWLPECALIGSRLEALLAALGADGDAMSVASCDLGEIAEFGELLVRV